MDKVLKKNSKVMMLVKAMLVSYIITGLLLLGLAMLLYKFDLSEGKITIGILIIYIFSCLLGGFIVGKVAKTRKFMWGLILGGLYFVILTLISLAVNREIQGDIVNIITTMTMCMAGGMLGGMIS